MEHNWLLAAIILIPLFGALFNGLLGKKLGKSAVRFVGVGAPLAAFTLALSAFFGMLYGDYGGPFPGQDVVAFSGTAPQIAAVESELAKERKKADVGGATARWVVHPVEKHGEATVLRIRNARASNPLFTDILKTNRGVEFGAASDLAAPRSYTAHFGDWIHVAGIPGGRAFNVSFDLVIDRLAIVLLLVITGVGSLIHIYSTGYMADRSAGTFARFFTYLNLFIAAMLVLVMGDNLLLMFVGWEGVGLCSYLLIGFDYEDPHNAACGSKAFIVNRIGDVGFVLGMMTLLVFSADVGDGALNLKFDALNALALETANPAAAGSGVAQVTLGIACVLLLLGATGKSAQIPLHLWLPDAMAGPTPVSALIHAATMVTAGIYMISRLSGVFLHAEFLGIPVLGIVAVVGVTTAFFAGAAAIGQDDIKKVLAYSTISQLGYMFVGVGAAAMGAAVFHLVTHAFFKALLFLGAGAVIHATHTQSMKEMGGLRRSMPVTFWTMLIGAFALAGFPLFSGFFSKDLILYEVMIRFNSLNSSPMWGGIYALGVFTGLLTAVYTTRLICMTFFGDYRGRGNPHEAPSSMTFPLVVLAVLAVLGGLLGLPALLPAEWHIHEILPHAWLGALFEPVEAAMEHNLPSDAIQDSKEKWGLVIGSLAAIAGVVLGILGWGTRKPAEIPWENPESKDPAGLWTRFQRRLRPVLAEAWLYDSIVNKKIVQPATQYLAALLWRNLDDAAIDRGLVDGTGRVAVQLSLFARVFQNGKVSRYAGYFVAGVVFLTVFVAVLSLPAVQHFFEALTQSLGS